MSHMIITSGTSRSFTERHPLLERASPRGEVLIVIGDRIAEALESLGSLDAYKAVLLELRNECLGVYTGEARGEEGGNVLGFARFRIGDEPPSNLVELVRQPATLASAIDAAKQVLEAVGLQVSVCADVPGRIIDRLVRPYYNAALRRLDDGLASAADMDVTLKLGLGYPQGPIGLLERSGLHHHFDVTQALYEATGDPAYAPARRARVAKLRQTPPADQQPLERRARDRD